MDVYDALRFSAAKISNELFSAGSIFSVYSLATTFLIAVGALAYQRKMRRGRVNLRAIARAIFDKQLLLSKSFAADVKLFVLSVVLMPVVVGALVLSTNGVATVVSAALRSSFGAFAPVSCCDLSIKLFSTAVLFLAYEIGYWVDHYLKHRIPFLWEFHKVHHTAEVLTPVTNFRNHPIDNIIFGYMLAMFIGAASGILAWVFGRTTESFTVDGKNILFIFFLWTIGHLQHSQFWIPFRGTSGTRRPKPRASPDPSFDRSAALQSQLRQRSRHLGLDVRIARDAFDQKPAPEIRGRGRRRGPAFVVRIIGDPDL